jgi:hypothetical protein
MNGFLHTRAGLFMDVAICLFTALPALLFLGVRLARVKHHLHRNAQASLFAVVVVAVALFETGIRASGGTEAVLAASGVPHAFVRAFLRAHIAVATVTALVWALVVVFSWRRFRGTLPGGFSRFHRVLGWGTFVGVCLLSSSGVALYWMLFVG